MKIFMKVFSYYWIIIPAIIGIVLFTTPLWLEWLLMSSARQFRKEQHQSTSLVDYAIPYNLKIRDIYVSDLTNMVMLEPIGTEGEITYKPNTLNDAILLLDSLKGKKTHLQISLTLNSKKDTLNQQEKIQLQQRVIALVGIDNIKKANYVKMYIFKATDYIIQMDSIYYLKVDDDYLVQLGLIVFNNGRLIE